ncbi:hypothetical protein Agub_g15141 [Astrephomene gubernaculifera]|uniref:Phosphodiesterase n=1 Tax=Astrephomene gubernaculifera TaxID=47775 RepID=A0AAD3E4X4_9CHLO|nr:hypothetical protein Agub_g15141 [Astrephomene gubernaculifera]
MLGFICALLPASWRSSAKSYAKGYQTVLRSYPSTLLWPLVAFVIFVGFGVWAVSRGAQLSAHSAKVQALSLASAAALNYQQQLSIPSTLTHVLASMVAQDPQYDAVRSRFNDTASALATAVPRGSLQSLGLSPSGIVRLIYPTTGNQAFLGLDLFKSDPSRPGVQLSVLRAAAKGGTAVDGPFPLPELPGAGSMLIVREAIHVPVAGPNETFSRPDVPNALCGEACAYNTSSGTKLWGFASALITLAADGTLMAGQQGAASPLKALASHGYRYSLTAPDPVAAAAAGSSSGGSGTERVLVVSSAEGVPRDPVEAIIDLDGAQWSLLVGPAKGSWSPAWYGGVVAVVVVLSTALALMLFGLLVSRRRHQLLLESLLPRELIRDLHAENMDAMGPAPDRRSGTDCPADLLVALLGCLLSGQAPELRDVVLLRTVLQRGDDVYRPFDLRARIKGANLDADVARSLMRQLGGMMDSSSSDSSTSIRSPITAPRTPRSGSCEDLNLNDRPDAGGAPPGAERGRADEPGSTFTVPGCPERNESSTQGVGRTSPRLPAAEEGECGGKELGLKTLPSAGQQELQEMSPEELREGRLRAECRTLRGALGVILAMELDKNEEEVEEEVRQARVSRRQTKQQRQQKDNLTHQEKRRSLDSAVPGMSLLDTEAELEAARGRGSRSGLGFEGRGAVCEAKYIFASSPYIPISKLLQPREASPSLDRGTSSGVVLRMTPTAPGSLAVADQQQRPAGLSPRRSSGVSLFGWRLGSALPVGAAGNPIRTDLSARPSSACQWTEGSGQPNGTPLRAVPGVAGDVLRSSLLDRPSAEAAPVITGRGQFSERPSAGAASRPASALSDRLQRTPLCMQQYQPPQPQQQQALQQSQQPRAGRRGAAQLLLLRRGGDLAPSRPARSMPSKLEGEECSEDGVDGGGGEGVGSNGVAWVAAGAVAEATDRALAVPAPAKSLLDEVERLLSISGEWQYDMWSLQQASGGHALSVMGFFLIQQAGLLERCHMEPLKLARLLRTIEAGYQASNPYHNAVHAADVLRTLHVLLHGAGLTDHYLDHVGLLAAYLAAIIHDYGHPGLTNDFLIATSHPLALRYNDRSPLESHHCAAAFSLMLPPKEVQTHGSQATRLDVLSGLSASERTALRKQMIEMVMATDMKQHFAVIAQFNTVHRLATASTVGPSQGSSFNHRRHLHVPSLDGPACALAPVPVDEAERLLSLQMALKVADLGHLGARLETHKRWLAGLEEEFFRQGDRERQLGMPISPLFDRAKQGVGKSQVGFYDFVALPLLQAVVGAFPGATPLLHCFQANYHHWRDVESANATPELLPPATSTATATSVPPARSAHAE